MAEERTRAPRRNWVRMRTDLHVDPAVISMGAALNLDEDSIVGKLHRVWSWATEQLREGNGDGVTKTFLDRLVCATGFADAMVAAGWLVVEKSGVRFPKWDMYLSEGSKARALTAQRVARCKLKKGNAKGNAISVTRSVSVSVSNSSSLEESTRETKPPASIEQVRGPASIPPPPELDTPDFRATFEAFVIYRRDEKRSKVSGPMAARMLESWKPHGPEACIAAMKRAMENGWKGAFPEKEHGNGRGDRNNYGDRATQAGARTAADIRAAKASREWPEPDGGIDALVYRAVQPGGQRSPSSPIQGDSGVGGGRVAPEASHEPRARPGVAG